MVILDIVLMALVSGAIVSLLMWSICTQYRDAGCEHLRVRRRLQGKVLGAELTLGPNPNPTPISPAAVPTPTSGGSLMSPINPQSSQGSRPACSLAVITSTPPCDRRAR